MIVHTNYTYQQDSYLAPGGYGTTEVIDDGQPEYLVRETWAQLNDWTAPGERIEAHTSVTESREPRAKWDAVIAEIAEIAKPIGAVPD